MIWTIQYINSKQNTVRIKAASLWDHVENQIYKTSISKSHGQVSENHVICTSIQIEKM